MGHGYNHSIPTPSIPWNPRGCGSRRTGVLPLLSGARRRQIAEPSLLGGIDSPLELTDCVADGAGHLRWVAEAALAHEVAEEARRPAAVGFGSS